jgi:hypothetical protein
MANATLRQSTSIQPCILEVSNGTELITQLIFLGVADSLRGDSHIEG